VTDFAFVEAISPTCKCPVVTGGPMLVPDCPIHAGPFGREVVKLRAEVKQLRADVEALLPPARLYLQALDADPDNEYLTLPGAILVTAVREAVARHDPKDQP
jgi:hypothetical protein